VSNVRFPPIADNRGMGDSLAVSGWRLEVVVGVVTLVALLFGIVGGLSPRDWAFWYAIPAALFALGILLAKRAHLYSRRGKRLRALLLGSLTALLIVSGAAFGVEHYEATPVDMGGHPL
jgi:peptidoglycan/LPS O-acetylase OafA/YrhL